MIPRFKPYFDLKELYVALKPVQGAVEIFEKEFAHVFESMHALAFSYGRSALWAFFKAMDIIDAEIIMPAYTCSVVAHAITLSGNKPKFIDISLHDFNMDLELVAEAINEKTRAIIATHLFGYPLDIERLTEIVRKAEKRYGQKIWVIQDCAHSFGAKWKGKMVCSAGDMALFGLNISKMITSIFGGMITTNNEELYNKLKSYRDFHFKKPGYIKTIKRLFYLIAVYIAFNKKIYGFVYWLQERTPFLDRLTKAYHLDEKIYFPPDYLDRMIPIEARVGMAQLKKYPDIVQQRREAAHYYDKYLAAKEGWIKPPLIDGATYSHYVVRVPDRGKVIKDLKNKGVELGQLIEYCIPHLSTYRQYADNKDYKNSLNCSNITINYPVYLFLNKEKIS